MNDFMKEELEDILTCVGLYAYDTRSKLGEPIYPDLNNKIQSMIDNYCEHESDGLVHALEDPEGEEIHGRITLKCKKCRNLYT